MSGLLCVTLFRTGASPLALLGYPCSLRIGNKLLTRTLSNVPIALGYFYVSFGFGILCINLGLSVVAAVGIFLTNLTSVGREYSIDAVGY